MVCSIAAGLYLEHRNDVTTNSISTSEEQQRGGGGGGARHRTACVGSIKGPARSSFPFLGFGRCVLEVEDLLEPDRSLVPEKQLLQRRMTCRHHRLLWLGCRPLTRRLDVSILHGFCRSASALTCFEREEIANSVLFSVRWGPSGGSTVTDALFFLGVVPGTTSGRRVRRYYGVTSPPPPAPRHRTRQGWAGRRDPSRHWGGPRAAKDLPGVGGPGGCGWGLCNSPLLGCMGLGWSTLGGTPGYAVPRDHRS